MENNIINFEISSVTCYIIKGKYGDLLVDTGFFNTYSKIKKWLSDFNVTHVFLTHAHADHDWNAHTLQNEGKKLLLSIKDKDLRQNFFSQKVNPTMPKYKFRNSVQALGAGVFNSKPYEPDIYITDENMDVLHSLGFDADIYSLPGHTLGSLGILYNDVLYCGDAFTALWKKPDISPHAYDCEKMKESLKTIMSIAPKWLACGHGAPVKMEDSKKIIEDYLKQY